MKQLVYCDLITCMIESEINRSHKLLIRQIESNKWGFSKKTAAKYFKVTQFLTNQIATLFSDIFYRIMLFTLVISSIVVVVVICAYIHTVRTRERERRTEREISDKMDPLFLKSELSGIDSPIDTQSEESSTPEMSPRVFKYRISYNVQRLSKKNRLRIRKKIRGLV